MILLKDTRVPSPSPGGLEDHPVCRTESGCPGLLEEAAEGPATSLASLAIFLLAWTARVSFVGGLSQKGWVGLEVWGLLITLGPEPQLNSCKLPDATFPVNADLIPHPLWVTASF